MTTLTESPAPVGLTEHSHVGGRTVSAAGIPSHLHPTGSADLADHPVPQGREEVWRFTPLRRLRGLHDAAPLSDADYTFTVSGDEGVVAQRISGPDGELLKGSGGYLPTDRPAARAWAAAQSVFLVDVPADFTSAEPVRLELTGPANDVAMAGHLRIRIGARADVQIVVTYLGSAVLADGVEIDLADDARATVVVIDDWDTEGVHLAAHHLRLGRNARITHAALSFGGDLVRLTATVDYAGPGGHAELLGVYFADAGQHLEQRLFVDHDAPHCTSRVLYKGALQGKGAHTVWVGDVLIRKTAEATDTYEMNRNLLLTEGARADSVPNLEIETGEIVGAGHASSTGRFDDDQLFYLLSRGIPEDVARRLVVRGFFAEVLQRIGIDSVQELATQSIERELAISGQ